MTYANKASLSSASTTVGCILSGILVCMRRHDDLCIMNYVCVCVFNMNQLFLTQYLNPSQKACSLRIIASQHTAKVYPSEYQIPITTYKKKTEIQNMMCPNS